jgi:hypothetical protein
VEGGAVIESRHGFDCWEIYFRSQQGGDFGVVLGKQDCSSDFSHSVVLYMTPATHKCLVLIRTITPHTKIGPPLITDRIMKLREVFNKAQDSKTKLSVNDFSE